MNIRNLNYRIDTLDRAIAELQIEVSNVLKEIKTIKSKKSKKVKK